MSLSAPEALGDQVRPIFIRGVDIILAAELAICVAAEKIVTVPKAKACLAAAALIATAGIVKDFSDQEHPPEPQVYE